MVTNQTTGKFRNGSSSPVKKTNDLFSRLAGYSLKAFVGISFENLFMIVTIVMLMMATSATAFVMGKDAERNISLLAAEDISATVAPMTDFFDDGVKTAMEVLKLDRAPTVVGLKENDAVNKLTKAKVEPEKIEVTRNKLTYPELVEKSDTLFFGEVETQKVSKDGIGLVIVVADMDDPFTAQMQAMGSRLAWPVPGNERISSHFGRRASPGGIGSTNHQGIDIPAPTGKPIIAVKSGTVESAGRMGGYGNCVVVDHQNGFKSLYGHMSQITCNAGDTVEPGDVIGKVGSTGWSTGPHLHFGLIKDGAYIDPEPFFTGKENVSAGDEVSINNLGIEDPTETTDKKPTEATNPDTDTEESQSGDSSEDSGSAESDNGSSDNSGNNNSSTPDNSNSSGKTPANKPGNSGGSKPTPAPGGGGNSGGNSGGGNSGGGNSGGGNTGGGESGGGSGSDTGGESGGGNSGGDSGGSGGGDSGGSGGGEQPTTPPPSPEGGN